MSRCNPTKELLRKAAPTVVFFIFILARPSTSSKDYYGIDNKTYPDDPLQVIWDAIDKIPEALDKSIKERMDDLFQRTQEEIEKLKTRMATMEGRLNQTLDVMKHDINHKIGEKMTSSEARVREEISSLTTTTRNNIDTLGDIQNGVNNMREAVIGPLGDVVRDVTSCAAYVNQSVRTSEEEALNSTTSRNSLDAETVADLRHALESLKEQPAFLPRDCSDHHWQRPLSPSGVYVTYPTMDSKSPVPTYCDMGSQRHKMTGGWTIILRRHNSSWGITHFNRSWSEYAAGFGTPGEGEWWYGLNSLHALTYRQPYEMEILMHDAEHGYHQAHYTTFRVESEGKNFGLVLEGFSGNVSTNAMALEHQGRPFSTYDRDNDSWGQGSCAADYRGGWWYGSCIYAMLTAPLPTDPSDPYAKAMRWIKMGHSNAMLVLDDVTMRVRPADYGNQFNAQTADGE